MPFIRSSALIATAYLALSARALPRPNPVPTYQVIDVGGPSTTSDAAPDTVYATVTKSSTPSIVTQPGITVTQSPSAPVEPVTQSVTTTQAYTVSIGNTEAPAYSPSATAPLPTLDTATPSPETATETVYNTVPVAPYAAPESTSSTTSSLKPAFTSVGQWNYTTTAAAGPTSAGTALAYAAYPTGTTIAKRNAWHRFAATGTGAYLAGRAAPTGTGVYAGAYLAGRAAPSGTGAYLYGRAAPSGTGAYAYLPPHAAPTPYGAQGWNATSY